MRVRNLALGMVAVVISVAPILVAPGSVGAAAVPFTDKNVRGSLGFCDKTGHEIKSGPMNVAPFVWFAAASTPAPSGYGKGKATLYAFQPIKEVDPGNWSGRQLTGSSAFTNAKVPMASGTVLDPALQDFVGAFPPKIDNFVQLRMYFNAPDVTQYKNTYPAAVLRVTSTTWTLVQGGGVNCKAGSAVSNEIASLPASAFAKATRPMPAADAPKAARNPTTAPPSPTTTSTSSSSSGSVSGSGQPSAGEAAKKKSDSSASGGVIAAIVIVVAVVAAGGTVWWYWRRRRIGT